MASIVNNNASTASTSTTATTNEAMDDKLVIDPKIMQQRPDSILGDPKWCEACQIWKPDRAHHCRVCDACVLKMDQ